jgi:hypothetical protein
MITYTGSFHLLKLKFWGRSYGTFSFGNSACLSIFYSLANGKCANIFKICFPTPSVAQVLNGRMFRPRVSERGNRFVRVGPILLVKNSVGITSPHADYSGQTAADSLPPTLRSEHSALYQLACIFWKLKESQSILLAKLRILNQYKAAQITIMRWKQPPLVHQSHGNQHLHSCIFAKTDMVAVNNVLKSSRNAAS